MLSTSTTTTTSVGQTDQEWQKTKLSLERPYRDDDGRPIPPLLDITLDGHFIYEPREEADAKFGEQFRRIFFERGDDFFDIDPESRYNAQDGNDGNVDGEQTIAEVAEVEGEKKDHDIEESHPMSPEELFKMRLELIPQLHIAYGEMSQARDLLSTLSSAPSGSAALPALDLPTGTAGQIPGSTITPNLLSASVITPTPPISSVLAFDAQLVTGGKDEALRSAADVLRTAADGIERTAKRSEEYWADALRLRKANWSLVPAPLPMGAPAGKGADKTSKDFLISYGLEASPDPVRRLAIAHLAFFSASADKPLVFPHSNSLRLRVTMRRKDTDSGYLSSHSHILDESADTLDSAISRAQLESLDKEIFAELIREAANLLTASSRVSERLIVIEAAEGMEIRFELVNPSDIQSDENGSSSSNTHGQALCNLIASSLPLFLLRQHNFKKSNMLKSAYKRLSDRNSPEPQILQPIIDLLQYQVFLKRVRGELVHAVEKLRDVKVGVDLRLEGCANSIDVDRLLDGRDAVGGEALLRVNERHAVRFTFASPSNLTAHLAQATVSIASIPQLTQILIDEIERSLLIQICDTGSQLCEASNGTWFVDDMMSRAVGRWEGCALNFRVKCASDLTTDCHAIVSSRSLPPELITPKISSASIPSRLLSFSKREKDTLGLFAWVRGVINDALALP